MGGSWHPPTRACAGNQSRVRHNQQGGCPRNIEAGTFEHRACQEKPESSCATKTNQTCVFPFIYKEVEYNGCAHCQGRGFCLYPWCATETDAKFNYKPTSGISNYWDYCTDSCPKTQSPTTGPCHWTPATG